MVLAAGLGTRMRPLTEGCPKPLLPLAGRPMIDLSLDLAAAAGVRRAVVNLHYLAHMIRAHLEARRTPEIVFSEEQPEILDTGGGIARALPLLGAAPFHVLNSDSVWLGPNPLEVLARAWDPARMDALLLLVARERARAYVRPGDFFLDAEGDTPRRRGLSGAAPYVYSGAQIIAPGAFAGVPGGAFSVNLVWDRLLPEGRLAAVTYPGAWVDVGTPAGLVEAEAALRGAHG
jgi:MurNAc alpha-1-phosphate uridylyltransferase